MFLSHRQRKLKKQEPEIMPPVPKVEPEPPGPEVPPDNDAPQKKVPADRGQGSFPTELILIVIRACSAFRWWLRLLGSQMGFW